MNLYLGLFRNMAFRAGFLVSAAIFFLLNLIPHPEKKSMFSVSVLESGFPFVNFRMVANVTTHTYFIHLGLVVDGLIGIALCFTVGLVCQFASENLAHRRKLKQDTAEAKAVK